MKKQVSDLSSGRLEGLLPDRFIQSLFDMWLGILIKCFRVPCVLWINHFLYCKIDDDDSKPWRRVLSSMCSPKPICSSEVNIFYYMQNLWSILIQPLLFLGQIFKDTSTLKNCDSPALCSELWPRWCDYKIVRMAMIHLSCFIRKIIGGGLYNWHTWACS